MLVTHRHDDVFLSGRWINATEDAPAPSSSTAGKLSPLQTLQQASAQQINWGSEICSRSDGTGRTGTYILIDMVLNRMAKGEVETSGTASAEASERMTLWFPTGVKEIDIAATLEHVRDQRPGMVRTKVSQGPIRTTRSLLVRTEPHLQHFCSTLMRMYQI